MKNLVFIFLLFMTAGNLSAQSDTAFSLQQCIDYAFKNQVNVVNSELDQSIAKGRVNEIKALGLPQINGSAALVDNTELPRMYFARTNPFAATFPGVEQSGNVAVSPNLFQLRSSGDANITIGQLIFDGSYLVGLQAASTYRELAKKNSTQTKIQTVENVTKAYYLVLINQERTKIYDINLQRLDSLLREVKVLNQNGFVEKIDVDRIEVQRNNLLTDKNSFDNLLEFSRYLLKFQMGMKLDQKITLTESLSGLQFDPTAGDNFTFDHTKRIEYSSLQTAERLQMLDLKRTRFSRLPTLSAFAKGGINRSDLKFWDLFGNKWYTYSMVGVNLSVPIVGFQSQYQAQQSKMKLQQVKNNLNSLEINLGIQAKQAQLTYKNNLQAMETQKRNMELAKEVSRVSQIKYKEGVGSNLEVTNAEADLQQAQINYYNALYDAIVSKVELQKAAGTLYNEQ